MGKIVIKKRVSLDFLGEDYKECFLTFRSMTVKEYQDFRDKARAADDSDDKEAVMLILDQLKSGFLTGKFIDEEKNLFEVKLEDLEEFDPETLVNVFQQYTGQVPDPKE